MCLQGGNTMNLYLVQHGQALSKDVDPDRALSPEGRADVQRMAAFHEGRIQFAQVLHSGKTRARQTAELLASVVAPESSVESIAGINPSDDPEPFAQQLISAEKNTLVAGHMPFMGKLLARLVTGSEQWSVAAYQPGSVVCLASDDGSKWQIQWMIRPELLRR